PSCGYNLRALITGRCPECGLALRLLLQPAHPRFGPFVLGLIGLSAGFGFGALMLLYAVVRMGLLTWGGPRFVEILPLLLMAGEGGLLVWWSLARRRIRRWPPRAVWAAAAGACALTALLAMLF